MSRNEHFTAGAMPTHMTAHELRHNVIAAEFPDGDKRFIDGEWNYRLDLAHERGLAQDIAASGVKEPVQLEHYDGKTVLADGHHRVASAYAANPSMLVPVAHKVIP